MQKLLVNCNIYYYSYMKYKNYSCHEPINWFQAENHAKANAIGTPNLTNQHIHSNQLQCPCCQQIIHKDPISLCQHTQALAPFGHGYPLYFTIIKYCIFYLLISVIVNAIFSLNIALKNNYDFLFNGVKKVVIGSGGLAVECKHTLVGLARLEDKVSVDEMILRVCTFCILLMVWICIRYRITEEVRFLNNNNFSLSTYSILINNMPGKAKSKKAISSLLNNYQINRLLPISNCSLIIKLHSQIKQLQHQKNQSILSLRHINRVKSDQFVKVQMNIYRMDEEIIKLKQAFVGLVEKDRREYGGDNIKAEAMIVCLDSIQEKEELLGKWREPFQEWNLPEDWETEDMVKLNLSCAAQPQEMIWYNINFNWSIKIKWHFLSWLILLSVLFLISVLYYLSLKSLGQDLKEQKMQLKTAYFIFFNIFALLILTKRYILKHAFRKLTNLQHYQRQQSQQFAFIIKYSIGMFLIGFAMIVIVHSVVINNITSYHFGYLQSQTSLLIFIALFIPVLLLLNPESFFRKITFLYYQRHELLFTQVQANKMMELLPHQNGQKYSQVINLIWLISITQSMIPLGSILGFVGLFFYYWIDKYTFLRRSRCKYNGNLTIVMKVMSMLEVSIILLPIGQLIFDASFRQTYCISSLVCLGIGLLYIILNKKIINYMMPLAQPKQKKDFTQISNNFPRSYEECHPIIGSQMQIIITNFTKDIESSSQLSHYNNNINIQMNKSILQQTYLNEPNYKNIREKVKRVKEQLIKKNQSGQHQILEENYYSPLNI